jgi:hypothetical protein
MNGAQWLWYGAQLAADEKADFELRRDVAEHNAMFWNAEGVEQVRNAREKTYSVSDDDFKSIIETTFGRHISLPDQPQQGLMHSVPIGPDQKDHEDSSRRARMRAEAGPYVDCDLDEINFIPLTDK